MKMIESGSYDSAIDLSVRKLSGKKKKKVKYVESLALAFEKVTKSDMRQAEALKKEGRSENWEKIHAIYRRIQTRQEKVEPLLPLYDKEGVKAGFRFVKIDDLAQESKQRAAEYLYSHAQQLLAEAEKGDKMAAREAYDELQKIERYYHHFRDKEKLKAAARDLGTTRVLFKIKNQTDFLLSKAFEAELTRMNVKDLDRNWKSFFTKPVSGIDFDYYVAMNFSSISLSPAIIKEREYEDQKEIEDGFEYDLDENGNVKKDTAGNDIKIPKKVLAKAKVFETLQNKTASLGGDFEIFDNRTKNLLHAEPVVVTAVFENYASTFKGDERALTKDSKQRIGNQPLPFPTDEALLLEAADLLKPILKTKILRVKVFR